MIFTDLLRFMAGCDKTKVYDPVGNFGSRNSNRIPFSFIPYGAGGRKLYWVTRQSVHY